MAIKGAGKSGKATTLSATLPSEPDRESTGVRKKAPDVPRQSRKRRRNKSLSAKCVTAADRRALRVIDEVNVPRSRTRGDCMDGPRPCPWVGCRHHLYLDVKLNGSLLLNQPDLKPWELESSRSLDVAERGSHTLQEVADILSLSRERIRQIEARAMRRLRFRPETHRAREAVIRAMPRDTFEE
ncbi:MAG: sigma factor-like helix-turn-helix DNA-binding protein [Myxococcota bacterium]